MFVYIAGPLTAFHHGPITRTVEQNVQAALEAHLALTRAGIPSHCPHLSGAFPDAWQIPHDAWMGVDLAVLSRCTHLLALPWSAHSRGAVMELDEAARLGLPIYSMVEDLIAERNARLAAV